MTGDASGVTGDGPMNGLDGWLGAAGFVDIGLAPTDLVDDEELDDPWADALIDLPTLTPAQRSFLLGTAELSGEITNEDVGAAEAEIIAIPDDPDDVEPFER